jgi:hypothetical protein
VSDVIPPITHRLGRHWEQPSTDKIVLDSTHALMSKATFKQLPEYSSSIPSGVYEGKMWKRNNGIYDTAFLKSGGKPEWLLMWYGTAEDPDKCSINSRVIVIDENEVQP